MIQTLCTRYFERDGAQWFERLIVEDSPATSDLSLHVIFKEMRSDREPIMTSLMLSSGQVGALADYLRKAKR